MIYVYSTEYAKYVKLPILNLGCVLHIATCNLKSNDIYDVFNLELLVYNLTSYLSMFEFGVLNLRCYIAITNLCRLWIVSDSCL